LYLGVLDPVDLLHAGEADEAVLELGPRAKRERRELLEVFHRLQALFARKSLEDADGVDVFEGRRRAHNLAALGVEVLRQLRGLPGAAGEDVLAGDRRDGLAGVLGIGIDLAGGEGLVDDLGGADAALDVDRVALGAKSSGIELAEDVLLGEVLRADRDRRLALAGLGRRRLRRGRAAAAGVAAAAAAGDEQRQGRESEQGRERTSSSGLHVHLPHVWRGHRRMVAPIC
jgi:hypothetical protein